MMISPSAHDEFAWIYNKIWGPYAGQAIEILDELILNHLPSNARILDLCCGTGQLSHLLTNRGYQVTGIDVSEPMVRFARKNAPNAMFAVQDARHFYHHHQYNVILSTYDSLNFVTSQNELIDVFRNVFSSLKPGGWFLFDMNTESGYADHWEDGTFEVVEDDHVCIVQTDYDADTRIAQFRITIFHLHDVWIRSDHKLTQRCYPENDIHSALDKTGFVDIRVWGFQDELGLTQLTSESERVYFLCRRP